MPSNGSLQDGGRRCASGSRERDPESVPVARRASPCGNRSSSKQLNKTLRRQRRRRTILLFCICRFRNSTVVTSRRWLTDVATLSRPFDRGNWQLCCWQLARSLDVALANSGVGSATVVSARGRTNGAAAWPSRRNGCRPSSTCTACTTGRGAPYRTPCGTSSSRRGSAAATTASSRSTPSAGPCSAGTLAAAAATALCAWSACPVL